MKKSGKHGAYTFEKPFKAMEGVGGEVFNHLSRNAVFVFVRFYIEFDGSNRFDLSLPYSKVKEKMYNNMFADAIFETVAYGFIDIIRQGGIERKPTIYGLSSRWRRLEKNPEKLDQVDRLLSELWRLKKEKGSVEKRMKIRVLKKEILKLSEKE